MMEPHDWVNDLEWEGKSMSDVRDGSYWHCRRCKVAVKSRNQPPTFHIVTTRTAEGQSFSGNCGEVQVLRIMES
jgi:hypothetical protein